MHEITIKLHPLLLTWLLCGLLVGCWCCEGVAQEEKSKASTAIKKKVEQKEKLEKIKYVKSKTGSYIKSIVFLDDKGEELDSFDVLKNNPYNQLNFPVVDRKSGTGLNIYKASGVSRSRLDTSYFLSPIQNRAEDDRVTQFTSDMSVYKEGEQFTVVRYNLNSFNDYGSLICYRGTAYILNDKGEVVQVFDHLETNIGTPVITNDGNYFGFVYGGYVTADGGQIYDEGFRIYEVKTKKLVADIKAEELEFFDTPIFFREDALILSSSLRTNGNLSKKLRVIFPRKNEIYLKEMDRKAYSDRIVKVNHKEIIFKNNQGEIENSTLSNYFKKQKLNENE